MAPPDPQQDGPSTANAPNDRSLAASLREAYARMQEVDSKRQRLRREISLTMEEAYASDTRYWKRSLARSGKAMATGSILSWAHKFALEDQKALDDAERSIADSYERAQSKQKELAAVDHEYWSIWRKQLQLMSSLPPVPPPSGSPSTTNEVPDIAGQPTNDQTGFASSASQVSGNTNQGTLNVDPNATNLKKRKVSDQSGESSPVTQPLSKPMLKLVTPASEAADAQGQSLSPTTQALKSSAMQTARSPDSPFAAPSPLSLASSPDPSMPPSGVLSRPRRRGRSSVATASSEQHSAPTSQPPTPKKSALASFEYSTESSPASVGGAQPAKRRKAAAAAEPKIKSSFTPINSTKPSPQALPGQAASPKSQDNNDFQGVTDLVVGEIYQAYYKDATQEGWWMCTPLPWGDWEQEIGIDMDFRRADMWRDLPANQYRTGWLRNNHEGGGFKKRKVISGWKGEFEEGGSKVTQRVFPVLFLDDVEGSPGNLRFSDDPEETYTFPQSALDALPAEWVAAKDVRMPGTDVGATVEGTGTAGRFRKRFQARKALERFFVRPALAEDGHRVQDTEMAGGR